MRRESFRLLRPKVLRGRSDAPVPPLPGTTAPAVAQGREEQRAELRPLGVATVDEWLGGGLRLAGLHEVHAAEPVDIASALSFALLLGQGGGGDAADRALIWIRLDKAGVPYGPGLVDLGLDPAAISIVQPSDDRAALRAMLDAMRSGSARAVLLELAGRQPLLDLTATRRLVLAAERSGTMALIVRSRADPVPSAAHSRWQVASAPSRPLEAGAPGLPAFALTLLRQRGGRDGLHIVLEWNRDTACFREPDAAPLSGASPAVATGGSGVDPASRVA